ncbi:DNA damage-inducible protein 1 [Podila epicladia]|nr:DNA damage-inducible protein 1 [Podila epicladia]KAG0099729.1 DNA damage-inducible protein 1 [Podila epicladia]
MRVSVLTEEGELHHLEFDSQMEVENIKALIEADCGVPAEDQQIFHNERELIDPKSTLQTHNVHEDDILTLRQKSKQRAVQRPTLGVAPGSARPRPPVATHPGQISSGGGNAHDAEQIRQHVLSDPTLLQQLRERQPALAEAAVNNPSRFHALIRELDEQRRNAESTRMRQIQALNENPFDLDAQQRIEEAIRLENVAANLEAALEYNPESFGRVTMLYIEVEVNGHPVKAFVDSGAQATIMSPECAEACGIMRLVDKRFAGIARGVGVAKILGRVHSAQIRVGRDLFLACSFTIMEGKGVDLLFGLDMLKRHQACIDLSKNALIINDIEVRFLSEHELPSSAKESGELTPEELASIGGTVPKSEAEESSTSSSSGVSLTAPPAMKPVPAPQPQSQPQPPQPVSVPATVHPEGSIQTLMSLGATRVEVIAALDAAGGNVDVAAGFLF